MKPLKDATESVGTMRGAALALTGVVAEVVAEATGSARARRLTERIDEAFGIDPHEHE